VPTTTTNPPLTTTNRPPITTTNRSPATPAEPPPTEPSTDHHQENTTTNAIPPTPSIFHNRAPPTLPNFCLLHTSYHRAPPTTAHLRPPLRYFLKSKHITHLPLPFHIYHPLTFITHHPPLLRNFVRN